MKDRHPARGSGGLNPIALPVSGQRGKWRVWTDLSIPEINGVKKIRETRETEFLRGNM